MRTHYKLFFLCITSLLLYNQANGQTLHTQNRAYGFIEYYYTKLDKDKSSIDINVLPIKGTSYDLDSMLNLPFLKENRLNQHTKLDIQSILKPEDMVSMKDQLLYWQNTKVLDTAKFTKEFQKRILITNNRIVCEPMFPKESKDAVFFPLFSCNGDVVLFYTENYCGMECGSGGLVIYQKHKNGSWKFIGLIPTWFS